MRWLYDKAKPTIKGGGKAWDLYGKGRKGLFREAKKNDGCRDVYPLLTAFFRSRLMEWQPLREAKLYINL